MYPDNYNGSENYRPTPAQQRVLDRFRTARQLPAHPNFWQRYDTLPLQALIRRGFIRFFIGPYANHYIRTYKATSSPNPSWSATPGLSLTLKFPTKSRAPVLVCSTLLGVWEPIENMSTCLSSKNGAKARKPHYCCLCGERINVGDTQDIRTGVSGGDMWTMHMHPECHTYEQRPGTVDPDWYEDTSEPAFERAEALSASSPNAAGQPRAELAPSKSKPQ